MDDDGSRHPWRPGLPLQTTSGRLPRLRPRVGLSSGKRPVAARYTATSRGKAYVVRRLRFPKHAGEAASVLGGVAIVAARILAATPIPFGNSPRPTRMSAVSP